MKLFKKLSLITILFIASSQTALAATCTLNGEVVPCSEMPTWFWIFATIFPLIGLAVFIFWLYMLIDAIKHQQEHKTMWVLLIIFTNILGAILYYFMEKRKRTV